MPKAIKKQAIQEASPLSSATFTSTNFGDKAEIGALLEEIKTWETIAETSSVPGIIDAEDVASFFVGSVEKNKATKEILRRALNFLEALLVSEGVEPKIKCEAERTIANIKKVVG